MILRHVLSVASSPRLDIQQPAQVTSTDSRYLTVRSLYRYSCFSSYPRVGNLGLEASRRTLRRLKFQLLMIP